MKHVYQFTAPRPPGQATGKQAFLEETRLRLAASFREEHGARRDVGDGTYPHFIGVFDTVAALINPPLAIGLAVIAAAAAAVLAFAMSLLISPFGTRIATFGWAFAFIAGASVVAACAAYVYTHFKVDYEAGWRGWKTTWHFTDPYPEFYDVDLDPNIAYAKHAISIDENRASFKRVPWGHANRHPARDAEGRLWFEQVWFAGNHADVGGGYPENESRLSDVALEWMLSCACEVPGGLRFDPAVLRRWPSAKGLQHDQVAPIGPARSAICRKRCPAMSTLRPSTGPMYQSELRRSGTRLQGIRGLRTTAHDRLP